MPTAGRLAGSVVFALFGWYLGGISIAFFPNEAAPTYWLPAASLISLFIGWKVCGARAGRGYNPAIAIGITSSFAIGFCLLFIVAFNQMVTNSLRLRYNGVMEALVDVLKLTLEYSEYFYDTNLLITLFAGGVVCAWITEFFGQRFP